MFSSIYIIWFPHYYIRSVIVFSFISNLYHRPSRNWFVYQYSSFNYHLAVFFKAKADTSVLGLNLANDGIYHNA